MNLHSFLKAIYSFFEGQHKLHSNINNGSNCFWLILVVLCLYSSPLSAQVTEEWVVNYGSAGFDRDYAVDMVVDNLGNSYVTGYTYWGSQLEDFATVKYDSMGSEIWVSYYHNVDPAGDFPCC